MMNSTQSKALTARKKPSDLSKTSSVQSTLGQAFDILPIIWPRAKIEYLTNPETSKNFPEFKRGLFTFSSGFQLPALQGILMKMRFGRIYFPKPFIPGSSKIDPICKSTNGVIPDNSIENACFQTCVQISSKGFPMYNSMHQYIVECPQANWSPKGDKPNCTEVYTLLMWETQIGQPVIFDDKSTGIKSLRNFKNLIISKQNELGHPGLPINTCFVFSITTIDKGTYYIPFFKILDQVPLDEAKEYAIFADDLATMFSTIDVSQTTSQEKEKP